MKRASPVLRLPNRSDGLQVTELGGRLDRTVLTSILNVYIEAIPLEYLLKSFHPFRQVKNLCLKSTASSSRDIRLVVIDEEYVCRIDHHPCKSG